MDDQQLLALLGNLQALSERLAAESRYLDSAIVAGGFQAIRGLRTKLEPAEAHNALKSVPPEAVSEGG